MVGQWCVDGWRTAQAARGGACVHASATLAFYLFIAPPNLYSPLGGSLTAGLGPCGINLTPVAANPYLLALHHARPVGCTRGALIWLISCGWAGLYNRTRLCLVLSKQNRLLPQNEKQTARAARASTLPYKVVLRLAAYTAPFWLLGRLADWQGDRVPGVRRAGGAAAAKRRSGESPS